MSSNAAHFFHEHKALFEFEKYCHGLDPLNETGISFLHLLTTNAFTPEPTPSPVLPAPFAPRTTALPLSTQVLARQEMWSPTTTAPIPIAQQLTSQPQASPQVMSTPTYVNVHVVANNIPQQPPMQLTSNTPTIPRVPSARRRGPAQESPKKNSMQPSKSGLLDSTQRMINRKVDMAQKIEHLVGPKFGRVIGPSSNLPSSVKKRLDAYSRLDQRKEALYHKLKNEYDTLQQRQSNRN